MLHTPLAQKSPPVEGAGEGWQFSGQRQVREWVQKLPEHGRRVRHKGRRCPLRCCALGEPSSAISELFVIHKGLICTTPEQTPFFQNHLSQVEAVHR